MSYVLDMLKIIIDFLGSTIGFFVERTAEAGIRPDLQVIIFILVFLTVWMGSAFWSASIAVMRKHSMIPHFIAGFVVPYVYPVTILFALDVKGARALTRQKAQQDQGEAMAAEEKERLRSIGQAVPAQEAASQSAVAGTPGDAAENNSAAAAPEEFDQRYFKEIALDDNGEPTGPWRIQYGGTEVVAVRIVESLPFAVAVEITTADGKTQKIRIPYAKITSCTPA